MRKFVLILVVLVMVSSVVFARGGQDAGGKVQIALLMRNMDEQFLKDYSDHVKKLAAQTVSILLFLEANFT